MINGFINGNKLITDKSEEFKNLVNGLKEINFTGKKISDFRQVPDPCDFNKLTSSGIYCLNGQKMLNAPDVVANAGWGFALIFNINGNSVLQMCDSVLEATTNGFPLHVRMIQHDSGVFPKWIDSATTAQIDNLQSQIDELKRQTGGGKA